MPLTKAQIGPKGALHRALHVPAGKKLPVSKLKAAAKKDTVTGRRARLVLELNYPDVKID
jgi:hypothetical protein